jgi:hypothetical protein
MQQTYTPIPTAWNNLKFEADYNCVAYAQDGELVVVSENGIDNLEAKIEANIAAYEEYLQNKTEGQATLETLGLTPAQLEALGL